MLSTSLSIILGGWTLSCSCNTRDIASREPKVFRRNGTRDDWVYKSQPYSCQKSIYGAMSTGDMRVLNLLVCNTTYILRLWASCCVHAVSRTKRSILLQITSLKVHRLELSPQSACQLHSIKYKKGHFIKVIVAQRLSDSISPGDHSLSQTPPSPPAVGSSV